MFHDKFDVPVLAGRWRALTGLGLGLAVAMAAASAVHAQTPAPVVEIRIGGSGAGLGTLQLLGQAYARANPGVRITVLPSMGSGGGIKAVLAGAIQIGVSARDLTDAETQAGATAFEYGRTPFVFATATSHPATAITSQNLIDFYAGRVDQWPDGSRLRLVLRPIGDSDSELIKSISPAMRDAKATAEQRKGMLFTVTDQDTASSIESTPGAIGPSTLALILSERRMLKALTFDGVAPGVQTLASGRYPLYKRLLLVTGPKTPASAQEFLQFVRSPAGRELLQQTGHWVR